MAKTVATWGIHSCNKGIGLLMMWASVLALGKRGTASLWHTDFARRMTQRKKRQELNSSLRCPLQQEIPYLLGGPTLVRRWRAERWVLLFSMLAAGGRTYACVSRVLIPRQQLPLLHGASSTHESRGCRRLYRFVYIQTTFCCLFHLAACTCCWSDHVVGWSRRKASALSVFCWCILDSAEYLMLFPL